MSTDAATRERVLVAGGGRYRAGSSSITFGPGNGSSPEQPIGNGR